jgi:hypothetical protein
LGEEEEKKAFTLYLVALAEDDGGRDENLQRKKKLVKNKASCGCWRGWRCCHVWAAVLCGIRMWNTKGAGVAYPLAWG